MSAKGQEQTKIPTWANDILYSIQAFEELEKFEAKGKGQ
jgi:hypothetical protein